jgi:eukaryotic-like serine/threonine-protein kinase
MGSVFLADDLRLPGRQCAVKRLCTAGADADDARQLREAFAREAAVLATLDHPALPKVSDYFEAEACTYLVMDYVPGQDLKALAVEARRRGRFLDEGQVLRWAEILCEILSYLHAQSPPVVHRDVKPANVKLAPDGHIHLVDFGLACTVGADADGRTRTVLVGAGSRPYQALEQYGDGDAVDARTDIYALGATLYHLLTARPPASAQDRFLHPDALDRPRALRPDLSARAEGVVLTALALHPDGRPASAEALRRLIVAPGVGAGGADEGPWDALRANGWLALAVVILALAAVALTLGH